MTEQNTTIATVDFDNAYSVCAGEGEQVDCVYFDVAEGSDGWYMSASIDCDSASFTDTYVVDDGPYPSEEAAMQAGMNAASQWMADNDYTDYEVDNRI